MNPKLLPFILYILFLSLLFLKGKEAKIIIVQKVENYDSCEQSLTNALKISNCFKLIYCQFIMMYLNTAIKT